MLKKLLVDNGADAYRSGTASCRATGPRRRRTSSSGALRRRGLHLWVSAGHDGNDPARNDQRRETRRDTRADGAFCQDARVPPPSFGT